MRRHRSVSKIVYFFYELFFGTFVPVGLIGDTGENVYSTGFTPSGSPPSLRHVYVSIIKKVSPRLRQ